MCLRFLLLLISIVPQLARAQYQPIPMTQGPVSQADATFASMAQQQQYMMQQQAIAAQQMQEAMARQQADAARNAQIQSLMGICAQSLTGAGLFGKSGSDTEDTAYDIEQATYQSMVDGAPYTDPELDPTVSSAVGTDIATNLPAGCHNFMDKNGAMGAWGQKALSMIRSKPESFGDKVPTDITKWCPQYPSMNRSQRELYWVWVLASMASSESSCNPAAQAQGPNGIAKGLFQVFEPVCQGSRNLFNANENITCAVNLLADELSDRATLMSTTSNGNRTDATYWGVLRIDDNNAARGGDITGAQKTRNLMKQYRFCNKAN